MSPLRSRDAHGGTRPDNSRRLPASCRAEGLAHRHQMPCERKGRRARMIMAVGQQSAGADMRGRSSNGTVPRAIDGDLAMKAEPRGAKI
jgi:hypothetical protein